MIENKDITALILSWNELKYVKMSVERLKEDGVNIWVADNGSTDGTKEWLENEQGINKILFPENVGISKAKNAVIEKFDSKYLLMLDGDVVYINGAAVAMAEELEKLDDAYMLGLDYFRSASDLKMADVVWTKAGEIVKTFMPNTAFGMFKGDLLKRNHFPVEGELAKPGWGADDDYINAQMRRDGYRVYICKGPIFFHEKGSGSKQLHKSGVNVTRSRLLRIQ